MQFLYTRPVTTFRWNSINFLLLSNRIPPSNGATWVGLPIRMFTRFSPTPLHCHSAPKTRLEGRFGVARFPKTWAHSLISIECECCSQGGRRKRVSHSRASKSVEMDSENDVSFRNNGLFEYFYFSYHRTPSIVLCFVFKQVGYLKIEERSRVWLPI